jgi:hypothetical protein
MKSKKDVDSGSLNIDTVRKIKPEKNSYSTEPTMMKIGDYEVQVRLPSESKDWNLEKERLQVNVTSRKGEEFYADFVTVKYITGVMKEKLPELGNGYYFLGRDRVIVKDLNKSTINKTLEDLLLNWENRLGYYFTKK